MTRVTFRALAALAVLGPPGAAAQGPGRPQAVPYSFVLDLAGTPLGEIPTAIKQTKGMLEVVMKDGQPMLKASVSSEFTILLSQPLPQVFTLEFDIVPKACCNPQDLSFEGTPTINQGAGSAHVMWDSDGYLAIVGGGQTYEAPMPEDLRATLPGVLTTVVAVIEGPTIKLYTNGKRHYTLDRTFARGRVLRVFLGVDPSRQDPVYLAGLRISAGAGAGAIASTSSALSGSSLASAPQGTISAVGGSAKPPGTVVGVPTPVPVSAPSGPGVTSGPIPARTPAPAVIPTTATQTQASTGGSVPTTVSNVSVTQGTLGPVVSWQPVSVAASYLVRRWKIDNVTCCNSSSPASAPLAGPPWQDAPLPVAGTYVYEVTAIMSGGVASGQAQFIHIMRAGGSIAATMPTTVAPVLVAPPTGTAVPLPPTVAPPPPPMTSSPSATATPVPVPPPPAPPPVPSGPATTTTPRTGGSSALILGPATLTATARAGWGVTLQWPEVVNALYYRIERGATNQSFARLATVVVATNPSQAGNFTSDDATILPGDASFYRVVAEFAGGVTAASPVTRYVAPAQVAVVTNLTVSVAGPCDINSSGSSCIPYVTTTTSKPHWLLTWNWDPAPGAVTHSFGEEKLIDPAIGFFKSTGGNLAGTNTWRQRISAPVKQTRFCVSLIQPLSNADPITNGRCLVTDIP